MATKKISPARQANLDAACIKLRQQKDEGVKLEDQNSKEFYVAMGWLPEWTGGHVPCKQGDNFYSDQKDDPRFTQVKGKARFLLTPKGMAYGLKAIRAAQAQAQAQE